MNERNTDDHMDHGEDKHHAEAHAMINKHVPGMISKYVDPRIKEVTDKITPKVSHYAMFLFELDGVSKFHVFNLYNPVEQPNTDDIVVLRFELNGQVRRIAGNIMNVRYEYYDSSTVSNQENDFRRTLVWLRNVTELRGDDEPSIKDLFQPSPEDFELLQQKD